MSGQAAITPKSRAFREGKQTMKKIAIFILALILALSLVACGTGGETSTATNSLTPDTSVPAGETNTPDRTPENTPDTTPTEQPTDEMQPSFTLQATESGTVSVAGTRYNSGRCSFIMPEGWVCSGTQRMDDANASNDPQQLPFPVAEPISTFYQTAWMDAPAYDALIKDGGGDPTLTIWQMEIIEYDGRIADFETLTAEEWYMNRSFFQTDSILNLGIPNVKAEKTTVDGYPAVRVTWQTDSTRSWSEFWAIDTQTGLIKINLYNGEVSYSENENRAWVEDFMSTFQVNP
jgi:hypothetical protein